MEMSSTDKRPLISFIVTVYNLERYIRDCLDSIINQPFDDYEIMLVNNSSTDGSDAICREYAEKYPQIRYYALTGEPVVGRATVHGAQESRGHYIQFVDVDDMLAPNVYDRVEKILKKDVPDVLFGRFNSIFEDPMLNFPDRQYSEAKINKYGKEKALQYLAETQPFVLPTWRLTVRRHLCDFIQDEEKLKDPLVRKVPLWENLWKKFIGLFTTKRGTITDEPEETTTIPLSPNLHYDVCSLVYTLVTAKSIRYIDAPLYEYRVRASSLSRITPTLQVSSCCIALFDIMNITGEISNGVRKTAAGKRLTLEYANQFHYQLCAALAILSEEEFAEATAEIEQFLASRPDLTLHKRGYPFVDDIIKNGVAATLRGHKEISLEIIRKVMKEIVKKDSAVYLAPTGNIGCYLKTAFEAEGVTISAFFDNDEQKSSLNVDGVPIHTPDSINKVIDVEKPVTILIGTRYRNARDELIEQFVDLGIKRKDLISIELI